MQKKLHYIERLYKGLKLESKHLRKKLGKGRKLQNCIFCKILFSWPLVSWNSKDNTKFVPKIKSRNGDHKFWNHEMWGPPVFPKLRVFKLNYSYLHCCMKCPQILREKTSSQKYTVIALRIQWKLSAEGNAFRKCQQIILPLIVINAIIFRGQNLS